MNTLLVDNYDSFTFNLYQLIAEVNGAVPTVVRNDDSAWRDAAADVDAVVISPGPGRPDLRDDFGVCAEIVRTFDGPILGVCLGHQGIAHLFGGRIDYAPTVMHGRSSRIRHAGDALFAGIPREFVAVRYHSLLVLQPGAELEATAWSDDGAIMSLRHRQRPIWGVQFHPESVATEYGHVLMANFRDLAMRASASRGRCGSPRSTASSIVTPRAARPSRVAVFARRLAGPISPERCFVALFASSATSFWLDSATNDDTARYSFMGDASGPLAERIAYDVRRRRIVHETADGTVVVYGSLLNALDAWLTERRVDPLPELGLPFVGGWVGYLGYEMRAECDGREGARSTLPDASLLFADRIVAFDHRNGAVWLVCCDKPTRRARVEAWFDSVVMALDGATELTTPVDIGATVFRPRHNVDAYIARIKAAKAAIRRGESYEICLTNEFVATWEGEALNAYRILRRTNPAPFAAFLQFSRCAVLSSSPERFLRIDSDCVVEAKPIKGTCRRGQTPLEDAALRETLRASIKDRAENLMIVDLLRNDLGRVCEVGSVHVPVLFDIESYASVHQMVSTVRGQLYPDRSPIDCVRAAFPGGSMTGAPKIRSMAIIDELEGRPRGVYAGAIGYVSLTGAIDFSIAIRTAVLHDGIIQIGAGGAIVDLSDPGAEVAEVRIKAESVSAAFRGTIVDFSPIEATRDEYVATV